MRLTTRFATRLTTGLVLLSPLGGAGQETATVMPPPGVEAAGYTVDLNAARVPFGPGEYIEYNVKVGPFGVGGGFMAIDTVEAIQGFSSYLFHWGIKGSILFGAAKIDDDYKSWMDTESLLTRRYIKDVSQKGYVRRKHYEMYPEELMWELVGENDSGDLASALPLDEISFVYFLRTLDLEVGKTISFNRYFKEGGNPVRIEVLRRDTRTTDAGDFNTIVVRPVIPGASLFDENAKAEIHLSDDENRYVVFMKSETGILGMSLSMTLKSARPGQGIDADSADRQQQ
jgi:Protein of unknown function (DUF3108)